MSRIQNRWRRLKWWMKETSWNAVPVEDTPVVPIVTYELPPEAPAKLESHIEQVESLLKRLSQTVEEQCQQK